LRKAKGEGRQSQNRNAKNKGTKDLIRIKKKGYLKRMKEAGKVLDTETQSKVIKRSAEMEEAKKSDKEISRDGRRETFRNAKI
jgi:hypothetical protein